jgi:pyruvate/2-oxoglutarate dehydrogenase complex dihydrolipoamide dehydrogenase (E3) component
MGGANLAYGAVPTQALIAAAEAHEFLRRGPAIGVTGAPLQVNLGKVRDHITAVTDAVAANVSIGRLRALGVNVVNAAARFADRNTITAGDATIRARRVVLAVGSVPAVPDLPGLGGVETITAESIFDLGRKSSHLIVLGATRAGFELAQAHSRLGIDATIIDEGAALAEDDPELAAIVRPRRRGSQSCRRWHRP